jgi:hypothetical protein
MDHDPIASLESIGYLEREAAFLYLVAIHSGYFVSRQYNQFVQRAPSVSTKFIEKAVSLRHLSVIECGWRRRIYHLRSRSVYQALLDRDSSNRKIYGDASIKCRLIVLDFLLLNVGAHVLEDEARKVDFFRTQCGIRAELLPRQYIRRWTYFRDRFPILVSNSGTPRFCFVDEGQLTSTRFKLYLKQYQPLFEALGEFELIYVSDTASNFARAKAIFHRFLTPDTLLGVTPLTPLGVEHFLEYLAASQRYEEQGSASSARDLELISEGERLYRALEHQALQAAWKIQSTNADRIRQRFMQNSVHAAFTTVVLPYSYPLSIWRTRRAALEDRRGSKGLRELPASAGSVNPHEKEA